MSVDAQSQIEILEHYAKSREVLLDFTSTLATLANTLLTRAGIQVHTVTHRCKDSNSLAEKLSRPEKTYNVLSDITDLSGLRITTYFANDVDLVARILEDEFKIDQESSIDKRKYSDPDRFGYSSLHYVIELRPARTQLPEYSRFAGLKCEVQVRSVLQHAWAEIEHDLGYKSAAGVPSEVRRRFARVAGLLELADDEFTQIRVALRSYEASVASKIAHSPSLVSLDLASFKALMDHPSEVSLLDQIVIDACSGTIDPKSNLRSETLVERLHSFGVTNVEQLERVAAENAANVTAFVRYWSKGPLGVVSRGIGAFYLLYVLAAKTRDKGAIRDYLDAYNIGDAEDRLNLADRIFDFDPNRPTVISAKRSFI
jgi:putative GTP pyrophosphokinase